MARSEATIKPKLRGVSHQIAFFAALVAGAALVAIAPPGRATWAALIYIASLCTLFGISAAYHRPIWGPAARRRMRRLDHSAIFVLIAGTYTPICLLVLGPERGARLLVIAWGGAGLGVIKSILWPGAPKAVMAVLCVALGSVITTDWGALTAGMSVADAALIAVGGLLYTIGALVYALRRPDPFPRVFGYHEVFHALVIAAAVCHFVAVSRVVLTAG